MLKIGNISLDVPFYQCPLSGYSDYAMRRLALDHGAPLTFAGVVLAKSAAHPKVMGKPFVVNVNVPHAMTVSEHDIETFMQYYPAWKRNHDEISWYSICDYPMLGVNKPITSSGSVACYLSQSFGTPSP